MSNKNKHIDNETLSIYEYLLIDSCSVREDLLESATANQNKAFHNLIPEIAYSELNRYASQYNNEGIIQMIKHEKNDFPYRFSRCRKDLGYSLFDIKATLAMYEFKRQYMKYLKERFNSLSY